MPQSMGMRGRDYRHKGSANRMNLQIAKDKINPLQ